MKCTDGLCGAEDCGKCRMTIDYFCDRHYAVRLDANGDCPQCAEMMAQMDLDRDYDEPFIE